MPIGKTGIGGLIGASLIGLAACQPPERRLLRVNDAA